jgi:polysaccharide export outer membrane protein
MRRRFSPILFVCLIGLVFTQTACLRNKAQVNRLSYFPNLKDTSFKLASANFEPTIQEGDILYVGVTSLDPVSSGLFNSSNSLNPPANYGVVLTSNTTPGYVIAKDGNIRLPKISPIYAKGKTKSELTTIIHDSLLSFLKEPVVFVRFMNYRVTVLGEVSRPGTFNIPNERVSILEALGLSGDLTIYGNRSNVLLIREVDGVKEVHRINLNSNSLFGSPFYYLESNDVLYVEPNKSREFTSTTAPQIIPIIFSSLSILIIIIDRVFR